MYRDGAQHYPKAVLVPANDLGAVPDSAFYAGPTLRRVIVAQGLHTIGDSYKLLNCRPLWFASKTEGSGAPRGGNWRWCLGAGSASRTETYYVSTFEATTYPIVRRDLFAPVDGNSLGRRAPAGSSLGRDHRQLRGEAQACSPEGGGRDCEARAPHVARIAGGPCYTGLYGAGVACPQLKAAARPL